MHPKIVLAPLRGVTGAPFRSAFARYFGGVDYAVAPFVAPVKGTSPQRSHLRELDPARNAAMPVIPQLIGNNPHEFVNSMRIFADLGYHEVNWNLGCPFTKVTRKKRGSGLLPYPDMIRSFLDIVCAGPVLPVSLKCRLGLRDHNELSRLLPLLNDYPLQSIIVHPRTADQHYAGRVDLERFAQCLRTSAHGLIYNGDITSVADFRKLQTRFPQITTWMMGRGVVADPFLPANCKYPTMQHENQTDRIKSFHDEICRLLEADGYGPGPLLGAMKELWSYLCTSLAGGDNLLKRIRKTTSVVGYSHLVAHFFASDTRWLGSVSPTNHLAQSKFLPHLPKA
ncbi:MAG: tRNA-dihydrouridine synthase family protein [Chitinivibrionales bacterium]|nr:tRNA-dihydrouridine synthase family protein [Chitinivibrionales bacterium]